MVHFNEGVLPLPPRPSRQQRDDAAMEPSTTAAAAQPTKPKGLPTPTAPSNGKPVTKVSSSPSSSALSQNSGMIESKSCRLDMTGTEEERRLAFVAMVHKSLPAASLTHGYG